MSDDRSAPEALVATALRPFAGRGGVVLAVSGGRDSVVLLHAAAAVARNAVRAVATFDHGTGAHARAAAALVRAQAVALGLEVVAGVAAVPGRTEGEWREARWRFLRGVLAGVRAAAVATAHTADDQVETVALRALRGAGARGLAGLAAPTAGVVRPLLTASRAAVAAYARAHDLAWLDDPANADPRHQRVRVRADLLPAAERLRPGTGARVDDGAARAAAWRARTKAWVDALARGEPAGVPVAALASLTAEALAAFWPAYAARAGVRLDRRATARLVAYTARAATRVAAGTAQPARVPVAGARDAAVILAHGAGAWRFVVGPV